MGFKAEGFGGNSWDDMQVLLAPVLSLFVIFWLLGEDSYTLGASAGLGFRV